MKADEVMGNGNTGKKKLLSFSGVFRIGHVFF